MKEDYPYDKHGCLSWSITPLREDDHPYEQKKNPSNSSNNLVIHYWFVCGHDTKVEVESAVRNESAVYGDILRLNYTETYSLLAFKTMSSL